MTHWGWYWKVKQNHSARTDCSQLISIDSFKLLKNSVNKGFSVQPFGIIAERYEDNLKITFRKHKNHAYIIPIDKQACNYGGLRYYFICPLCDSRMRLLYLASKSTFLCRKCLNLGYKSQRLRPTLRYDYMTDKVTKSFDSCINIKPKNMHTITYNRLKNLQHYYEQKSYQAINIELRDWYGDKIEPYLDRYFDYAPEKPKSYNS